LTLLSGIWYFPRPTEGLETKRAQDEALARKFNRTAGMRDFLLDNL